MVKKINSKSAGLKVNVTSTDAKLGMSILQINLPVAVSCRKDAPCYSLCYASHSFHYRAQNVRDCYMQNYNTYKEDSTFFFNSIIEKTRLAKYVRWHSSGDIVDGAYFAGMVKVARANKGTFFLAFTKKFDIVNDYLKEHSGRLPRNLKIVFSAWDKDFKVDNPYNLPIAYIDFKDKSKNPVIPATAIPCLGLCYKCLGCWSLPKGGAVCFHQHR